jgi:chitinase domain-containing protein 1
MPKPLQLLLALAICCFLVSSLCLAQEDDFEEDEDTPFLKNVLDRKLVTPTPTYRSILKENTNHGSDTDQRHFLGPTLGYITPWHRKGYEIATKFHCKFDMVSPAWFQVKSHGGKVSVTGEHDINAKWVTEIRESKPCPHRLKRDDNGNHFPRTQILPRFLIEGWTLEGYQALFTADGPVAKQFLKLLVSTVQQHDFDGLVLDAGYLNLRSPWRGGLIALMKSLGRALHQEGKLFVLVIPPYRGGQPEESLFNGNDFADLLNDVDFFSMMTYDFSNAERPGPSSPLEWFVGSHAAILTADQKAKGLASKLLGGVNLYANDFAPENGGGPIIADGVLALLKSKKPKIVWDEKSKEHRFDYQVNGVQHRVWFPTLQYIQQRIETATTVVGGGLSFWELGQGMDYFYDLL